MKILCGFICSLWLTGIALAQTVASNSLLLPVKPESGKALVYVIRPSSLPYFFRTDVFLDGKESSKEIGSTNGGEYIYFNIEPGEHVVNSYARNWSELKIVAKAGDIFFIKQKAYGLPGLIFNELSLMPQKDVQNYFTSPVLGKFINKPVSATHEANAADNNESKLNKKSKNLNLQATLLGLDADGVVTIQIQTSAETRSIKINTEELGGKSAGLWNVKKLARVGQESIFTIVAAGLNGETETQTLSVNRLVSSTKTVFSPLNATHLKQQPVRDAVAIIIGIEKYKRVAQADYANVDAQDFYDYASRALGIKQENIKLLLDEGADDVEIYKAFQNWLPLKVNKGKTDVFVFYSGHGLPSLDGHSLYLLPYGADKDLISKTAINQQEIIASLQAVQPKSVTMFLDSCYSGQTRGGETLLASARPIALKVTDNAYPANFTVISASAPDQLSSSSPELKHGIFSYYLMKGMEGEADLNKDNKITVAEMQEYLTDMVGRQAMGMNRKQQPQLFGDPERVLVGR